MLPTKGKKDSCYLLELVEERSRTQKVLREQGEFVNLWYREDGGAWGVYLEDVFYLVAFPRFYEGTCPWCQDHYIDFGLPF